MKPACSMDHVGFTLHIADIISNWRNVILSGDTTVRSLQTCAWAGGMAERWLVVGVCLLMTFLKIKLRTHVKLLGGIPSCFLNFLRK
jgi:hypothetical protein